MKGSYILVIFLEEEKSIRIGSLGKCKFPKGYYLYVGSAMGNSGSSSLINRVKRHLLNKNEKKLYWHVDYFLADTHSYIKKVYLIPSNKPLECILAQELMVKCDNLIKNFGSSDCNCISHLFYFQDFKDIRL